MNSAAISIRVPLAVKAALQRIADEHGTTEAWTVELLVLTQSRRSGHIALNHPDYALVQLEQTIGEAYLDGLNGSYSLHVTRDVFAYIQENLKELYNDATTPPSPSCTCEQRRRYVHQRLGRFVKEYLGLDSLGEVILPPNSGDLIRAYTKLGRASAHAAPQKQKRAP